MRRQVVEDIRSIARVVRRGEAAHVRPQSPRVKCRHYWRRCWYWRARRL